MARLHKSAGRRAGVREPPDAENPPYQAAQRWPLVIVVVLCLVVGGAILERMSRPREQASPDTAPQGRPATEGAIPADASASAARLTVQELVEEARQLAAQLQTLATSAEGWNLAGAIYESLHDTDKAADCWQRTLAIRPDSPEVLFNLGFVAWQVGNYEKAKSHFLKAYALDPDLGQLRYYLADCLLKLGEGKQAIAVLEGAKDPNRYGAKGRCVLGHAYTQSGDLQKARQNFEAALVLDPKHRDAHYGLIQVLMRLHEPGEAKKHRDAAATLQQAERQAGLDAARPGEVAQIAGDARYLRRQLAGFYRSGAEVYSRLGRNAQAESLLLRAAALWPEGQSERP